MDYAPKDFDKADSFLAAEKEQNKSPLSKFYLQHQQFKLNKAKSDGVTSMFTPEDLA